MPRPFVPRCIARLPDVTVFKPAGVPVRELRCVEIHAVVIEQGDAPIEHSPPKRAAGRKRRSGAGGACPEDAKVQKRRR